MSTIVPETPNRERPDPEERAPHASLRTVSCWSMALLLLGASGIHFAAMGEHAGVSWSHGLFFAATAWAQLVLAAWLALRQSRAAVIAAIVTSFAVIVVWLVSRTVGIAIGTDGTPEAVAFADALCTVFEALTVGLGLAVLSGSADRVRVTVRAGWVATGVVGIGVITLSSFGFTPAVAGGSHDHGSAAHAHDATEVAAPDGHTHASPAAATSDVSATSASHPHNADQLAELEPDQPLDPATRALLAEQLVLAREAAARYPTVADAQAAGMIKAGEFAPGVGAHYIAIRGGGGGILPDGSIDPRSPGSYIYDGTGPQSRVVGVMYTSQTATAAPEGFAGPNDHWHRHTNVCIRYANGQIEVPFSADADVTAAQCAAERGRLLTITTWMVHAWVVPGWESPQGVFSHANPNVLCADGTSNTDSRGTCAGTEADS